MCVEYTTAHIVETIEQASTRYTCNTQSDDTQLDDVQDVDDVQAVQDV